MKTIGIIGGLGPMATVYYLELITCMTDADSDQGHPRIALESVPDTPDRTAYILGESAKNPLPVLQKAALDLQNMGAEILTIPCITAHYFYDSIAEAVDIPMIHLPRSAAQDVAEKGIETVGILATSGTLRSGILEREFASAGVRTVVPEPEVQVDVMQVIYGQVKKGVPVQWNLFRRAADNLQRQGAQKLILGCTELSLLKRESADEEIERILRRDCVDVLDVLAQHAVLEAGVPLKDEYRDVID